MSRQPPVLALPDVEALLTAELAAVVTGARRRALRDGDRQIDTAHLLHSLMEQDLGVGTVFNDPAQVARVLGYLVQRSIGYGLAWQGSVEDSGALSVLREGGGPGCPPSPVPHGRRLPSAAPDVPRRRPSAAPLRPDAPGWSPSAAAAMTGALERARRRGSDRAGGIDVLACVAADPDCRAAEVLRRAGVDVSRLGARISQPSRHVSPE
ncbi:Clp protease N-terminal domain-containing protein [Streptomyces sp. NPDC048389]|uniref:Clp protease N-terminal domain-containing protein n=1 Tax=Streptomyces sp. NPDC048389 TaxID=3154622 RepID=UPI003456B323